MAEVVDGESGATSDIGIQESLDAMLGFYPPQRWPVVDDHGGVEGGASQAHHVLAENGREYIIKGSTFTEQYKYVAANEFIAASLGTILEYPVLEYCVIEMRGDLFFGSLWMPKGTFRLGITAELFERCSNRESVYDLVVFDTWLCNVDRHNQNLIVRTLPDDKGALQHTLLFNDHSHCLVWEAGVQTLAPLEGLLDEPAGRFVAHLDFERNAIRELQKLSASIARVENLSSQVIQQVVRSMPEQFLPSAERGTMEEFLIRRKSRLREVFMNSRNTFPNLEGGEL